MGSSLELMAPPAFAFTHRSAPDPLILSSVPAKAIETGLDHGEFSTIFWTSLSLQSVNGFRLPEIRGPSAESARDGRSSLAFS